MTMRISVQIDSAAAQAQLRRWGGEFRDKVKKAVSRAIASEAVELKQDVRSHVASQMAVASLLPPRCWTKTRTDCPRCTWVRAFRGRGCTRPAARLPGGC
jgi:hypothetical protein